MKARNHISQDHQSPGKVPVSLFREDLEFAMQGELDIIDVTNEIAGSVRASGLKEGTAAIFVPGATGAVTCLEFEPGVVTDFREALERLFPISLPYHHEKFQVGGNGHAHVRAGMLGPSLSVPFSGGELMLGTWQQIVLINCDNRPRNRKLIVQVTGC